MDKKLLRTLSRLSECNESVKLCGQTSALAQKASSTAVLLNNHGREDLSGARIIRAEKLLKSLRDSLEKTDGHVARIQREIEEVAIAKPQHEAQWNTLGDAWYIARAKGMSSRLRQMDSARQHVQDALDVVKRGDGGIRESYGYFVNGVDESVKALVKKWGELLEFVEEWKDVALVVAEGVGESGSLIPGGLG